MDYYDILLLVLELVLMAVLFFLAGYAEKAKNSKWRLLYLIPVLVSFAFIAIAGFEKCLLGIYIGSALCLLGFIWEDIKHRRRGCVAGAVCALISLPLCLLYSGYRAKDYLKDFENGFTTMREHYILAEHKGIDWEAIYDEYRPLFVEATEKNDEMLNFKAWMNFCGEFNDGHVYWMPNDEDVFEEMLSTMYGNDYGLAIMQLADGRYAAVAVEPDSALTEAGIHDGTIITAWDGQNPLAVAEQSEGLRIANFADEDNLAFMKAFYAGGVGGDTVTLSYLDDNGAEREMTLSNMGKYYDRATKAMDKINRGVEAANMEWVQISDKTACLRIKSMMFDMKSSHTGDHDMMKDDIRIKIDELNAAGVDNIVIDLRSNGGGSGQMVQAIAELLAPAGEHYYCTDGLWDEENRCYATDPETGDYIKGTENYYTSENLWEGKDIVILVNHQSASAADHFAKVLGAFDNVTVMGFSESYGSAQGIGGVMMAHSQLVFSSSLLLDKDGSIFIDGGEDMQSGSKLEVKVPFDHTAIEVLFEKDEDYLMNKALEMIE